MSAQKSRPAGNRAAEDQRASGSETRVPRRSIIAPCRAFRTRGPLGHYWLLVVDECPECGGAHTHGGGEGLRPSYGFRAAGCIGLHLLAGYWLEPIHDNRAVNA